MAGIAGADFGSSILMRVLISIFFKKCPYQTREQIAGPLRELARITEMLVDIKTCLTTTITTAQLPFTAI